MSKRVLRRSSRGGKTWRWTRRRWLTIAAVLSAQKMLSFRHFIRDRKAFPNASSDSYAVLGALRACFRRQHNIRSNTIGDYISGMFFWSQVVAQMKRQLTVSEGSAPKPAMSTALAVKSDNFQTIQLGITHTVRQSIRCRETLNDSQSGLSEHAGWRD
jgi:hypothetical protein